MPTTQVTPELGTIIKELRKLTNTTSKEVAERIRKSSGFVSNVENCKTPTIDCKTVFDIFKFLQEKSEGLNDASISSSVSTRIEQFLNEDIKVDFSETEIEENKKRNTFYILFDKQYRIIHIEDKLVIYLQNEIDTNHFTAIDVMKELNSNRYLPEEYKDIEPNTLQIEFLDTFRSETIRFKLRENLLDEILSKKVRRSNYVTLHGIVYALQLLKGKDKELAANDAHSVLYDSRTYTLEERNRVLQEADKKSIITNIRQEDIEMSRLPENEKQYYKTFRQLFDVFDVIKDKDVDYIVAVLNQLLRNIKNYKLRSMTLAMLGMSLKMFEDIRQEDQKAIYLEMKKFMEDKANEKRKDENVDIVKFDE